MAAARSAKAAAHAGTIMGVESNGMVLAASLPDSGEPVVLVPEADVPPGTKVK